MKPKLARFLVLRDNVVAKFPWTVISAEDGKPALWQHDAKIGKVPLRFRSEAIAKAAADKLNAAPPE